MKPGSLSKRNSRAWGRKAEQLVRDTEAISLSLRTITFQILIQNDIYCRYTKFKNTVDNKRYVCTSLWWWCEMSQQITVIKKILREVKKTEFTINKSLPMFVSLFWSAIPWFGGPNYRNRYLGLVFSAISGAGPILTGSGSCGRLRRTFIKHKFKYKKTVMKKGKVVLLF